MIPVNTTDMLTYSAALPNYEYGHLLPPEDSHFMVDDVFSVADGITRDPPGFGDFNVPTDELLGSYPNPSGARLAADIFCQLFVQRVTEYERTSSAMLRAFRHVNAAIASLNRTYIGTTDYLTNDWFGCVGCACSLVEGTLLYVNIGDTGVAVFSRAGDRRLITRDGLSDFNTSQFARDIDWNRAEWRRKVRSEFRNRPAATEGPRRVGYGAVTGEPEAEAFLECGSVGLEGGDLLVAFTDGMRPLLEHPEFFNVFYQDSSSKMDQRFIPWALSLAEMDPGVFGKERTLVACVVEE